MNDCLPARIPPDTLAPLGDSHLVPALITAAAERAGTDARYASRAEGQRSLQVRHGPI